MVKDIYAIYESYITKEAVGSASANNSERGNINLQYVPIAQGSTYGDRGENEEVKQPVALLKGAIAAVPGNTVFNLKGKGNVTADTIRARLGRLIELMSTKAGIGDYNSLWYLMKDLHYYIQANQEVSETLKMK